VSIFRRTRRVTRDETRSKFDPLTVQAYAAMLGIGSRLGVSSIDEALREAATWACVLIKAKGMASTPVDVVRYDGERRIPMPLPEVIARPSAMMRRRPWTFAAAASMFTDGNVWGMVTATDASLRPRMIELVAPEQVIDRRVVDNVPQARIDGEVHQLYPWGDLWHVAGEFVLPGTPFGLSPVGYGSRVTATALAAEEFGGQWFVDGAHPTAVIIPEADPGPDGAAKLKAEIMASTRGNREPIVLSRAELKQLQSTPSDSRLIELMEFEVLQTCRRHGVPPSMVYATVTGQNVTYSNVTQADLNFLKHTLSYPFDLLEEALTELLPGGRVVRYRRDAVLRGDPETRWRVYETRLRNRTISVNEVRALEDEPPYTGPEFDEPGVPMPGEAQGASGSDEGGAA